MNTIEIKEIVSADIRHYAQFLLAALQTDKENLLITAADDIFSQFPTKDRNDSFTIGGYINGVLAGVVSFVRDGENRQKLRHKGIISTMVVSPAFRGHGIAKNLLEEVIQRAKSIPGIEQINLVHISSNTIARQLYEKYGFRKFGTERHSIKWEGNYQDEDLMVLYLYP